MKIAVISVTEKGRRLSRRVESLLSRQHMVNRYCFIRHTDEDAADFSDIYGITSNIFTAYHALIFICACGIAVRSIAPHIRSKDRDPAVVVLDDCGRFAIPVLSGHLGGANRLAEILAEKTGMLAIITTATDVGGQFSPDSFAKANQLLITDLKVAKKIAAAVLSGEKIGLYSDYSCRNLPPDIVEDTMCRTGVCISADPSKAPFPVTLNLIPRNIVIGIGCKRGTSCDAIERHVADSLRTAGIDSRRICALSTITIKADEPGLLAYCEKHSLKLHIYTAEELMEVSGNFIASEFVKKQTGADNICERSAVRCSGGKLILRKTSGNGVTAAAAELPVTPDFERKIQ
ncbi:MAG: cobalt-precorrin 5A hydrolase [Ruminococcus sp.]|nr:cobalt-precorrin 5A hydrolase [Ruminococcus sp.]